MHQNGGPPRAVSPGNMSVDGVNKGLCFYMCESGDYNYGMSFVSRVWQADADQRDDTEGQNIL